MPQIYKQIRFKHFFSALFEFFLLSAFHDAKKGCHGVTALQANGLFLDDLIRIYLPVFQCDLHQVLPCREALQVDIFQAPAL